MKPKLVVTMNHQSVIEYNRDHPLAGLQRRYLDQLDQRMDQGVTINHQAIESPDEALRAQYVASKLCHALKNNDDATISASCAYLAVRQPDLLQVQIVEDAEGAQIELVYTEGYSEQAVVPVSSIGRPDS